MRRNFAQMVRESKIDIHNEYTKLYEIFYGKDKKDYKSLADLVSAHFINFRFRGTCLTLEEFDRTHNICFEKNPKDFNVDYLVNFMEYVFNFISQMERRDFFSMFDKTQHINHILKVAEAIGYTHCIEDDFTTFVPSDNIASAVSEIKVIPESVSHKIISYNHHSMKGDVETKRATLLVLANQLEPYERKLSQIDASFKRDLFYAFNNLNIRHNNIDPYDKRYYKEVVANMPSEELERWYDETYQMCLLAFMRLEQSARQKEFDSIKDKIEAKK